MKLHSKILMLCLSIFLTTTAMAQEQKKYSSKILKDIGIEEVSDLQTTNDGYFLIGAKGYDAENKNLWLIKMNTQFKIISSTIIYHNNLNGQVQCLQLPNNQLAILAQIDNFTTAHKHSILLLINKNGAIINTVDYNNNDNIVYNNLVLKNNAIVLIGTQYHTPQNILIGDKIAYCEVAINGTIIKQHVIDIGKYNIETKHIISDGANIIFTANLLDLNLAKNTKPEKINYKPYWMIGKINASGELIQNNMIPNFADYSKCNSIVANEKGLVAIINPATYFNQSVLVQLNNNLEILKSNKFTGSPSIISGINIIGNTIILGAVFSNNIDAYYPGFISISTIDGKLSAKASEALFNHFFINSISAFGTNQYVVSGTGYTGDNGSDIYLHPFTNDGSSHCPYVNIDVTRQNIILENEHLNNTIQYFETHIEANNIKLVTAEAGIKLADICEVPDEPEIAEKDNKNWDAWQKRNANIFKFEVPQDWLDVYPNPTQAKVTVQYKAMRSDKLIVSVINSTGHIMLQEIIENNDKFELNFSSLAPGIYYIKVNDGKGEQIEKITKE
jgi:Secretion system C-terminal sorting domain